MWFNPFRLTLTLPIPATNSESGSLLCRHLLQGIATDEQVLFGNTGLVSWSNNCWNFSAHKLWSQAGGFKKRGVTEVGIKMGFMLLSQMLSTSELPGLSLRLPASQLESKVERGREVFQLTLGPRAALAASKDKGDECN